MNLSLRTPRTSGLVQVSRFITWHQRHHQDCSETTTNFFSFAARANVASFHSLQNPSLFSIGAARAAPATSNDSSSTPTRIIGHPPDDACYLRVHSVRWYPMLNSQGRELDPAAAAG